MPTTGFRLAWYLNHMYINVTKIVIYFDSHIHLKLNYFVYNMMIVIHKYI